MSKSLALYRSRTARRPPSWNARPRITQYLPAFRRLFAGWSTARHARRTHALERLIAWLHRRQAAAIACGERVYGTAGALLSGGSREHWPEAARAQCRIPAQAATTYGEAAVLHARLGRIRRRR